MRIAHNLSALTAYNALNAANNALQKSIQQLSTGLRVNSASDDAAGLAISERIRAQTWGLDTAIRNAQDGVSLLQTAEGALESTHSILHRMRELSVQASNDTLTSNDRGCIQLEIDELKDEINRIANTTRFNGKRLLDGSSGAVWAASGLNTKAFIRGGIKGAEGNYNIQITAEPGAAQVQKSNIFNMAMSKTDVIRTETVPEVITEIVTNTEERIYEISIDSGLDILGASFGDGWSFDSAEGILRLSGTGPFNIVGTETATTNRIVVEPGTNTTVFLTNVNIDVSSTFDACAFDLAGATVDLYLSGENTLSSGDGRSGLEVPEGASLTITSANGDGELDGKLLANGGAHGAGIGGRGDADNPSTRQKEGRAGEITINGGTIEARGNLGGAGIGGADTYKHDGGGTIVIHGGDITAYGGDGPTSYYPGTTSVWHRAGGAGIGSGYVASGSFYAIDADNTNITISGGTIKAYGGNGSAGIGGGSESNSGVIYMKLRDVSAHGGEGARDIGWGFDGVNTSSIYFTSPPVPAPRDIPELPTVEVPVSQEVTHTVETLKNVISEVICSKELREIKQFYTVNGVFLVDPSQTITITQGDGRTATVTLYANDTMSDVAQKINDAIADGLGQRAYVDDSNRFCTLAGGTENTSESVYAREPVYSSELYKRDGTGAYLTDANGNVHQDGTGEYILDEKGERIPLTLDERLEGYAIYSTMLVRSAVPGKAGELSFSGDADVLAALGLNTIQESSESSYTASVYDAHTGAAVATNVKAAGNRLNGVIHENVDVEFDAMSGITAAWNEATKSYALSGGRTSVTLHLSDKSMAFQVGANRGEELYIDIGDMSADGLGITNVNVSTRERAARSIGTLDRAINRVSAQRARIGAYQNSLEYTAENLTTTLTNLTAAESRIRDADMASAMMEFVKLQILNQSGTSMLAQANQLPQSVLNLIR